MEKKDLEKKIDNIKDVDDNFEIKFDLTPNERNRLIEEYTVEVDEIKELDIFSDEVLELLYFIPNLHHERFLMKLEVTRLSDGEGYLVKDDGEEDITNDLFQGYWTIIKEENG